MSRDMAKSEISKVIEQNLRPKVSAAPPLRPAAAARPRKPAPLPSPQASVSPPLPPAAASSMPRQLDPPPPAAVQPQADPEFSSVPRPPMPVR
jgi:hypothetical protein